MKRTAGLAALAVLTVAGLAPATALSPQRAVASASAGTTTGASATGATKLWAARYRDQTQRITPTRSWRARTARPSS